MPRMMCSLSLDLDNLWSYMKTHGDAGWDEYPSYLGVVVPRVLDLFDSLNTKITWFIVGKDAADPKHHSILGDITRRGHEVGNHSFHHEPWLHLYSESEIEAELARTEDAIETATGQRPDGFRGPGFSFSPTLLKVLARRGYRYDASTFPTFLGPLARLYYFAKAGNMTAEEREKRKQLFGTLSEGFRSLHPYNWHTAEGALLEIPVTTMPLFKVPIHLSYLVYLSQFSKLAARAYLRMAVGLCKVMRVELSFLLHPLDFMGCDDTDKLAFFPAMNQPSSKKLAFAREVLELLIREFQCVPMGEHAAAIARRSPVLQAV
jgi:peptidoglycan-N-acetylglucosamine deacetylase